MGALNKIRPMLFFWQTYKLLEKKKHWKYGANNCDNKLNKAIINEFLKKCNSSEARKYDGESL